MDKLIVFTEPDYFNAEVEQVTELFRRGLSILHLRKPSSTKEGLASFLRLIPEDFLPRVTLHDHFELVDCFAVGGVHLNSRNQSYSGRHNVRISKSCHSFAELKDIENFDYVTLSPIFDSISKQGYRAAFHHNDLLSHKDLLSSKVIALGGVNYDNIQQLHTYGFGGAAMLGNVWNDFNADRFSQCLESLKSYNI